MWGEKIVLRVLDTGGIDLELKKLGFTEDNYERFSASFTKPHGMVLVTGPTGSGKSTTLYATLTEISKPEVNIITVEDPVEYRLPGVNQVQVNHKAGLTFAAVLPAILRSDPDVVLIGEIRDRTTAQLAVEAALTGHLVLSTLHTNDAPSAVTRLIEMGIEPFLVGSSLDCVLAQRLARRLCDWCKERVRADRARSWSPPAGRTRRSSRRSMLWRPVGCRSCASTGYRGRIALHEVMPVSRGDRAARRRPRLGERDPARSPSARAWSTLRTDGLRKAARRPDLARRRSSASPSDAPHADRRSSPRDRWFARLVRPAYRRWQPHRSTGAPPQRDSHRDRAARTQRARDALDTMLVALVEPAAPTCT